MNVTVLTALIESRSLINGGWCRSNFAQDANGNMCDWGSDNAKSFCSIGAIYRATDWRNTYDTDLCLNVFEAVAKHMESDYGEPPAHLVRYNDAKGRTKEEVLDAFDKTIAAQIRSVALVEAKELELA